MADHPRKIYLSEDQIPRQWYNVVADMPSKPDPILNPGTKKPMTLPVSQQYFYGTYSNQWNLILAGFVVSTLPIVIFYIVMQKHIVKGIAAGAVKG